MTGRNRKTRTVPLGQLRQGDAHSILLSVLQGPDSQLELASAGPQLRIGRDQGNDVVLHDAAVSGFHCEITLVEGRARVRDNQSRNGIFLNGARVYDGELPDGSILTIGNTLLRCRVRGPAAEEAAAAVRLGPLVSRAASMREVVRLLEAAARSDVSVLLTGETGTGKSVGADLVHRASRRAKAPLITVDCGAITPTLLESELFGHARGAFTGATTDRAGAFEAAAGGVLFLDEIGDLPLELQPVLLRALETRQVRRLGTNADIAVDVRLIAATNRELRTFVEEGRFRSDLFYRLAVLEIAFPPLRERPEDVSLIVAELVERVLIERKDGEALAIAAQLCADATLTRLEAHAWPGNVRELRNYVHRCFALGELVAVDELAV